MIFLKIGIRYCKCTIFRSMLIQYLRTLQFINNIIMIELTLKPLFVV